MKIKREDREICENCSFWSENYRYPYDAGAMALCVLHSMKPQAHPSVEGVMIYSEEHNPEKSGALMPLSTRWNFGCNQFEKRNKK